MQITQRNSRWWFLWKSQCLFNKTLLHLRRFSHATLLRRLIIVMSFAFHLLLLLLWWLWFIFSRPFVPLWFSVCPHTIRAAGGGTWLGKFIYMADKWLPYGYVQIVAFLISRETIKCQREEKWKCAARRRLSRPGNDSNQTNCSNDTLKSVKP